MDTIRNVSTAHIPAPLPRRRAGGASVPVPKPASEQPVFKAGEELQAAELKRLQRIKKAAGDLANSFVLGDSRFTIFKDATGQYITRFTSLRDGRVTYIPEPQLLRMSQASEPSVILRA